MMNHNVIFRWIYERGKNYNLFILDENDYHDDDDDEQEIQDPEVLLKQQKYATWLYVLLLLVSLYVLFYLTLMTLYSQTITVSPITRSRFEHLHVDHAKTLSCPCSKTAIPHRNFISNNITFHPVCSSVFVSEPWIEALYLVNASDYGPADFRATAKSQVSKCVDERDWFQLLADLCSISKGSVNQTQMDFDDDEYTTTQLFPQEQVQSESNVAVDVIQNAIYTQIVSFLNYIRAYGRSSYIVSALNTNTMFSTYLTNAQYNVYQIQTQYTADTSVYVISVDSVLCSIQNPTTPTGFFPNLATTAVFVRSVWTKPAANSTLVNGFFTGCTSLEALLVSTLDCLYDSQCIQTLTGYFPALSQ
ncbi:unnamed protein product, partial [Adineta ricciae]